MSPPILVLGVDPGFASLGWCVLEVRRKGEYLVSAGVFRTEPSGKKRLVLAADDNVRRSRLIAGHLDSLLRNGVQIIAAESMSHVRGASASAKVGNAWGVIATLAHVHGLPIAQLSPQAIKASVATKASASKQEVADAVVKRYGREHVIKVLDGVTASQREHAYDAIGAAIACLDHDVIRLARILAPA